MINYPGIDEYYIEYDSINGIYYTYSMSSFITALSILKLHVFIHVFRFNSVYTSSRAERLLKYNGGEANTEFYFKT